MQHRYLLLAGAAALGLTAAGLDSSEAGAADCFCKSAVVTSAAITPGVPPPYWQGFYVGANIGGAWSDLQASGSHRLNFPDIAAPYLPEDLGGGGVFGGLQLGYNWQAPGCCFVFGVEADIGGMDAGLGGRTMTVAGSGDYYASFKTNADAGFYGDIAGRAGYSWGHTLLYAKGGFAWFDPGLSESETVVTSSGAASYGSRNGSTFLTGWTAGAGFESMITPRWSWKIEYLHFDFGLDANGSCCFDGARNFRAFNSDLTVDTVKVGFSYLFNDARPVIR
jgi:outer membrane immunogenic protein